MIRFHDLSVRRKVTLSILAGTISTLLIGAAALITFELANYRREALREMTALAKVLGTSSTGALAFNDERGAGEILSRLAEDPSILAARLFRLDGQPLATYHRRNYSGDLPEISEEPGHRFATGRLYLNQDVEHQGDRVGQLFLAFDLATVRHRLLGYVTLVAIAIVILIGISFATSTVLQRFVSAPILDLAGLARRITERQDYSVRAVGGGQDEIGILNRAFNQMLDAIQTRERELEASRQSLALAQTAGRIGSFDWNAEDDITVWSPEMDSIYGVARGSFRGTHDDWISRVHPADRERVLRASDEAARGKGDLNIEYRIVWPDGTVRWVVCRARYFMDDHNRLRRVVGVNIDITDRKTAEGRLLDQAEQLWRSNQELEQFAYVSSHDLQEPLRKVASYAELLGKKYHGKLGEEADRYIQSVTDGVSRMRDLIQDLLSFSRLARTAPPTEAVDLNEILRRVVEDLEPTIRESGAQVDLGRLPVVQARPSQMQQLFQNLVSNALKFRGAEPPRVSVSVARRGDEHVFSVRDNGIGIEAKYADKIFKVFQRLHPRGQYPGTGIGLAICKKIVEQHGGRIWVESELGRGSTFRFSIPLVQPEASSPVVVGEANGPGEGVSA